MSVPAPAGEPKRVVRPLPLWAIATAVAFVTLMCVMAGPAGGSLGEVIGSRAAVVMDADLVLERSVMISGEEAHRMQVPVRERFDFGKPVRICLEANGSDFRICIDGRVVDFFHDDLLPSGGVGFMGGPEGRPRIYWMRVRHHDDLLGRVCAWLSPGVL